MPNWNFNQVTISGTEDTINAIMDKAKVDGEEGTFSMDNFYPTPKDKNGEPFSNWYGWRVENWGCKWDINQDSFSVIDSQYYSANRMYVEFGYNTPWGPNLEFWERLAEEYEDFTISVSYCEEGNNFCGMKEWTDGNVTIDDEYSMEMDGAKDYEQCLRNLGFESEADYLLEWMAEEEEEEAMAVTTVTA